MTRRARILAVVIVLLSLIGLGWWIWDVEHESAVLSGYVEGEALYLSSATAGTLDEVFVRRGQRVAEGDPLFVADAAPLIARRDQAAAALSAARARLEDARKGVRPSELSAFDAEVSAARAQLKEAQAEYARIAPLAEQGVYAPARFDRAAAARDTAAAQLRQAEKRRETATLGARADAVSAARAQVDQALAALAEAESRLAQVSPRAPAAATVQEVFFQPGEWAAPNQPVVALIPDGRVRLRFFVPERDISKYKVGAQVSFTCDGCAPGQARIDYISPKPEFTPPVIYSRDARERMVFLVEARPAKPRALNPGQPIDVEPAP